jgi:hypothetical protein
LGATLLNAGQTLKNMRLPIKTETTYAWPEAKGGKNTQPQSASRSQKPLRNSRGRHFGGRLYWKTVKAAFNGDRHGALLLAWENMLKTVKALQQIKWEKAMGDDKIGGVRLHCGS